MADTRRPALLITLDVLIEDIEVFVMSGPMLIYVLGGGGVGKSALTLRLVTDNFAEDYDPTIEDSYRKQIKVDGIPATVDIVDTAGQEEYNAMRDQWIRNGKGFLLVYSISNRGSFKELENIMDEMTRAKDDDNIPIVLAGNKCDLDESEREVQKEEGQKLAEEWGVPFFETSAKTKINDHEVFYEIVREVRKYDEAKIKENGEGQPKKKKFRCDIL